jgi:hypothetical protein
MGKSFRRYIMKAVKPFGFFAQGSKLPGFLLPGILAVLLAGCFNPMVTIPPDTAENAQAQAQSFTVDIFIGPDTQSRSIAGPDNARIMGDIRNIIQLIVMDDSGKIVVFNEVRRKNDAEKDVKLIIEAIPFGKTYHFLLLMGHWERDYGAEAGGNYEYTDNPPTLLAAGLWDQLITGNGKVTMTMWPIVVDTTFTSGIRTAGPVVNMGKPEAASLLPVDWDVTWTLKRGLTGNGLMDLVNAQKIPDSAAGDALLLKSTPQTMVREGTVAGTWSDAVLNGNVITRSIKEYTSGFKKIGTKGSVNFKMEYVPFNLTGAGEWSGAGTSAFDLRKGGPVWIIRNGVNDLAQDGDTDFNRFHNIGNAGMESANGNGAVRFEIAAKKPGGPGGSTLVVKDGVFLGPVSSTTPEIAFTTEGHEGKAEIYYAVVPAGTKAPDNSAYELLNTVEKGYHREKITVPAANGDYDVHVILFKDGDVSASLIINTAKGGADVDWIWGDKPHVRLYVKSDGLDTNWGDKAHPLATVERALDKLAHLYAAIKPSWPGRGTELVRPGAIIILDTVEVTQQIEIKNQLASSYPPIIICDDPETPGGKLQVMSTINTDQNRSLLRLEDGVNVTLSGRLILAGTGKNSTDYVKGVFVTGKSMFTMKGGVISDNSTYLSGAGIYMEGKSTFTMTGGKISSNSARSEGGGLYLSDSTFIMKGGEISGNFTSGNSDNSANGGGIYLNKCSFTMNGGKISDNFAFGNFANGGGIYLKESTFIMKGGEISGNFTDAYRGQMNPFFHGGGVCMGSEGDGRSVFIMYGGTISGNSAFSDGGGVYLGNSSIFTMTGGEISGNSAKVDGGGVYHVSGKFTMTNGEISGNTAGSEGGGVCLEQPVQFTKSGGTIYGYAPGDPHNNKVVNSSKDLQNNKGHAIYVLEASRHKETTVGPSALLDYNVPRYGDVFGWD